MSYLTARPTRRAIAAAHQQISKLWWERRRQDFDLVVSELVLKESAAGEARGLTPTIICTPEELMGDSDEH